MSEAKVSIATASPSASPRGAAAAGKGSRGPRFKPQAAVSRDAQRVAAVILEVLAGMRTPTEAAAVVGLSVPRYYLWEQRALEGLVRACEPRPKGKVISQRHQIAVLEKEVARLRQDCARQQALVRASQRTIGLTHLPGTRLRVRLRTRRPSPAARRLGSRSGPQEMSLPARRSGSGVRWPGP